MPVLYPYTLLCIIHGVATADKHDLKQMNAVYKFNHDQHKDIINMDWWCTSTNQTATRTSTICFQQGKNTPQLVMATFQNFAVKYRKCLNLCNNFQLFLKTKINKLTHTQIFCKASSVITTQFTHSGCPCLQTIHPIHSSCPEKRGAKTSTTRLNVILIHQCSDPYNRHSK